MKLEAAKKELTKAKKLLIEIQDTKDFGAYESVWNDIVGCLGRLYNKVISECTEIDKKRFRTLNSKYANELVSDSLLKYLREARNTIEHSHILVDTMEKKDGQVQLTSTGSTHIQKLVIMSNGQIGVQMSGSPLKVEFIPEKIEVKSVFDKNNNEIKPPRTFNGVQLRYKDPLDIVTNGISYYESYIDNMERQFYQN